MAFRTSQSMSNVFRYHGAYMKLSQSLYRSRIHAQKLINLREVKSNFLMCLNSVLVGCLLIMVPYFITPSKFSCCHVLGFEFAITQDQSLLDMFTDAIEPSDFNTASFDLTQKINNGKGNRCKTVFIPFCYLFIKSNESQDS